MFFPYQHKSMKNLLAIEIKLISFGDLFTCIFPCMNKILYILIYKQTSTTLQKNFIINLNYIYIYIFVSEVILTYTNR